MGVVRSLFVSGGRQVVRAAAVIGGALAWAAITAPASAQSTGFTYQGRLAVRGQPARGLYDMKFRLYSAARGGDRLGEAVCADNVFVEDGLFTVVVPLGAISSGVPVYLEIETREDTGRSCGDDLGFVPLGDRQLITPVPIAVAASVITERSPSVEGALRYNRELKRFEGYTGVFWVALSQGAELPPRNIQTFGPSTGTTTFMFVVPEGVTRIGVDLLGAGGGGGTRADGAFPFCGGATAITAGFGGGGGAAVRAFVGVIPGETLTVIVGLGGAGGTTVNTAGQAGGSTILRRGTTNLLIAGGGGGGSAGVIAPIDFQFFPPCGLEAGGGPGNSGLVSVPGPAVTVITQFSGGSGRRATRSSCANGTTIVPSCAGVGGAGATLPVPMQRFSGFGGSGGELVTVVVPAQSGAPGNAAIWWD